MEATKLLILRVTDRCNLACRYCYAAADCPRDMSLETAKAAIDLFAKEDERLRIQFTGGEPLLCPQLLWDIFQYTKARNIRTAFSIQTNGTLLTEENCRLLKAMRCAVGVSLDGVGDANKLRCFSDGRPSFPSVTEGIRNLAAAGLSCNINAVVSAQNQAFLQQLPELALLLGNVKGIGLDMFRPLGRGKGAEYAPDPKTLERDLLALLQRQEQLEKLGLRVVIKELEKVRLQLQQDIQRPCYCYAGSGYSAAVSPDGVFYPCSSFVGLESYRMGSVEEGWTQLPQLPEADRNCLLCSDWQFCMGGCPAGRAVTHRCSETDCLLHRTIIRYGRERYAKTIVSD